MAITVKFITQTKPINIELKDDIILEILGNNVGVKIYRKFYKKDFLKNTSITDIYKNFIENNNIEIISDNTVILKLRNSNKNFIYYEVYDNLNGTDTLFEVIRVGEENEDN